MRPTVATTWASRGRQKRSARCDQESRNRLWLYILSSPLYFSGCPGPKYLHYDRSTEGIWGIRQISFELILRI